MSERCEYALALLLPAIAVSWVIADAATGIVVAGRDVAPALTAAREAGNNQPSVAADSKSGRASVIMCAPDGDVAATISATVGPDVSLQRLCQAGLKFSASLPRT